MSDYKHVVNTWAGLHSATAFILEGISSYCDLQQEHSVATHW